VTLCGEMASRPIGALALIALGYRSLSLTASAIGPVKAMILDLDTRKAVQAIRPLLETATEGAHCRAALEAFAEAEGLSL